VSLYSATALAEASGCTLRQIEYWTNRGYLTPVPIKGTKSNGTGNLRVYSDQHVLKARLIRSLLDSETAARVATDLIENKRARVPGFTLTLDEWSTS
jgi:DNA-binding transcriptional MerR regulator